MSKKLNIILILLTVPFIFAFDSTENEEIIPDDGEPKATDFIFEIPDVVKDYIRDDGTKVRLDAYRTQKNTE